MLKDKIESLSKAYFETYRSVRHHLHAHPELSYKEFNTSQFIQNHFQSLGIPFKVMAETGVVALIEGKKSNRVIALRADIDALPIQEENNTAYASKIPGVMHACGHDVHTTILLGAAKILHDTKQDWEGTVKLIFQPGEEKNPGGASILIKEGVLENPAPTAIIGLHVHPILETGKLSFRTGKAMASADEIYVTVKGKGGHAATPHLTADTVLAASELVVALQKVVSRDRDPLSPSVLSICAINGGFTTNVIPAEVKLMGTFRAMDEPWRFNAHKRMQEVAEGIATSSGAEIDFKIDVGYPAVHNDPAITQRARSIAISTIGESNVEEGELRMGAEDFGYYSQKIAGCFFRLGTGNKQKNIVSGVHTPTFDIDEDAIEIGMRMMATLGATL
ncbi:MAG: amidohydrolase [Bacteroidetes bacterium]|nr:amidohydrolase [Bacteroidota bacterium]